MINVIVHWDHKPNPTRELLRYMYQQFDYAARAFLIDKLVFVDTHQTLKLLNPPETIVDTIEDALILFPEIPRLLFTKYGTVTLNELVWPKDVTLIFGPDYTSCEVKVETTIQIPTPSNVIELWASQAMAIALACQSM